MRQRQGETVRHRQIDCEKSASSASLGLTGYSQVGMLLSGCSAERFRAEIAHAREPCAPPPAPRVLPLGFGFRVSGFGLRVSGFGLRVSGFCFRVSGFGFRVSGFKIGFASASGQCAGFRVQCAGFRVQVPGFRVQGSGSRVQTCRAASCVCGV